MIRVILGLLKGGLVGAALGYGAMRFGIGAGGLAWLVYGAVGFLVGVVCGKPPWRQETLWTSIIKGVVGLVLCMGLYWVAQKLLGDSRAPAGLVSALGGTGDAVLAATPVLLAPLIGVVYGIFVEVDDGGKAAPAKKDAAPAQQG
jgi:hypothetical protein